MIHRFADLNPRFESLSSVVSKSLRTEYENARKVSVFPNENTSVWLVAEVYSAAELLFANNLFMLERRPSLLI